MIVLLICRANTADHVGPIVYGAFYRAGGYPQSRPPKDEHQHTDAPTFPCIPVFNIDEDIPAGYPHVMRDGTSVVDADAYLLHLRAHIP